MPDQRRSREGEPDLLVLVGPLLARWRVVGICGVAGLAAGLLYAFLGDPVYESKVTFLPHRQQSIAGALFQFAGLPGFSGVPDPDFEGLYERILKSDRVLDQVLVADWRDGRRGLERFAAVFEVSKPIVRTQDSLLVADKVKKRLRRDALRFRRDRLTGYMELGVSLPNDPVLCADLANFLAVRLDEVNQDIIRARASDSGRFLAAKVADAAIAVAEAETSLAVFESSHRGFASSPDLNREHSRLQREVQVQVAVWTELRKQAAQSEIEASRDMASVTVLDRAMPAPTPYRPRRGLLVAATTTAGLVLGLCLAGILAWYQGRQSRVPS